MCIRWRTKAGNCMTNSSKEQVTQAFFFSFFFGNQTKHLHDVQEWGTYYMHGHAQAARERQSKTVPLLILKPSIELKCLKSS